MQQHAWWNMNVETIDPAWEIAGVIRQLLAQPASNDPTWKAFQVTMGSEITGAEYFEILAVLRSRLSRFDQFVKSIQDSEFDEELRQRIIWAIGNFGRAFEPAQQAKQWQETRSRDILADDAMQLSWFSVIAKRHRPLRRLGEDDRKKLITLIDEVLADIDQRGDVPGWAKDPLAEGMRRLQLVLRYLLFFGHEEAIDELLNFYHRTMAIKQQITIDEAAGSTDGQQKTIWKILTVLATLGTLLCFPDQAITAFERYKGLYLRAMIQDERLPKNDQLLLPAPVAVEPRGVSEEEGKPK